MPTVAICIPTYNQARYLEEAICSAVNQTHPVTVWISDDCSSDNNTERILSGFGEAIKGVKVIRQRRNLGISRHLNRLLRMPKTDYIVRLDSDDVLEPTFVERLLPLMENAPAAGYAHASVKEIDAHGKVKRIRQLARNTQLEDAESALNSQASGYRVSANILMFRRKALQSVGFYNDAINFAEDWDLAVRLADAGWGNIYVKDPLASYRVYPGKTSGKRKIDELNGVLHVYDDALAPAFSRKNWDTGALAEKRRAIALSQCADFDSKAYSEQDREQLKELLLQLGDSPALRLSLFMLEHGSGRLLRDIRNAEVIAKDQAKRTLRLLPPAR